MTIDEAIKHAEEVAEEKEKLAHTYENFKDYGNPKSSITSGHEKCLCCAEEHRQLAEWLRGYQRLLEQTRLTDGDRAISLNAVKKLICKNNDKYGYSDRFHEFTEECLSLPPITSQSKKGHWIHQNDDFNDWLECSKCGYGSEGEVKYGEGTTYCPNCGADMRYER